MTIAPVDIFSLLCCGAGWFYLFYSKAAAGLSTIESTRRNALRVVLRRMCGVGMFLLGVACFAGFNTVDDHRTPRAYVALWLGVMALLLIIMALAAADIHLTWKLRRKPAGRGDPS
jgi:hypothetical protein